MSHGSSFLQSLGWATLNSFWQFALLWVAYLGITYFTKAGANRRYLLAVASLFAGAAWFAVTFIRFYISGVAVETLQVAGIATPGWLPAVLTSASLTYLLLLTVPAFKVIRNWRFLQTIRHKGLQKAPIRQRLFVQNIAGHLGIRRKVLVYLSSLVTSPVTIGYLKPVILIPVAAIGQLTPAQLEAILLHELTHIRRHDYLLNLLLTAIHVVLYFNPFVKLFMNAVETEREHCCDELVLQFEYDKLGYASALLQLQKSNHLQTQLAMAATQQNNLLHRVERIVGIRRKTALKANHFLGAFAALLLLLTINSMIIAGRQQQLPSMELSAVSEPLRHFMNPDRGDILLENNTQKRPAPSYVLHGKKNETGISFSPVVQEETENLIPGRPEGWLQVAQDDVDASLNETQKAAVKTTLDKTKKALSSNWPTVERNIIDGVLPAEKESARKEYYSELEKIDWQRMEQNMKARYSEIDFEKVNAQLNQKITEARIDSARIACQAALAQLKSGHAAPGLLALPDASIQQLQKVQEQLQRQLLELKNAKERKTIKL